MVSRWVLGLVLGVATANGVRGEDAKKYFPLAKGNQWSYRIQNGNKQRQVGIDEKNGTAYRMKGLPCLPFPIWLKHVGHDVYIWDDKSVWSAGKWKPFLKFGAPQWSSWSLSVSADTFGGYSFVHHGPLVSVENPIYGKPFGDVQVISVKRWPVIPGTSELWVLYFAAGIGLVKWVHDYPTGIATFYFQSGAVGGKKLGKIPYTPFEASDQTGYPAICCKGVLVLDTKQKWEAFYQKHKPGATVPTIDFSKKTMVVALAGPRPSKGYQIKITEVMWKFPAETAGHLMVTVQEKKPSVFWMGPSNPVQIVVLDAKGMQQATVEWVSLN